MNKKRKKAITELLETFYNKIGDAREELVNELESIRDDEQDALDNVPESLTCTERYEQMETSIELLDDVIDNLESECSWDCGSFTTLENLESDLELDLWN